MQVFGRDIPQEPALLSQPAYNTGMMYGSFREPGLAQTRSERKLPRESDNYRERESTWTEREARGGAGGRDWGWCCGAMRPGSRT